MHIRVYKVWTLTFLLNPKNIHKIKKEPCLKSWYWYTKMISEWLIKTRLLFDCTFHLQNMYQDSIFDLTVDLTSCSWNCCCRSCRKHWTTMPFWRGCKYWQKCVECGRGMILQIMLRQWVSLWTFWRLMAGTPRHPRTLLILHAVPGNVAARDPGDKPQFCSGENVLTKSCSLIKIKMFNELWRSLRIVPHSHLVPVYCCKELWENEVRKSNLLSFYLWF